MIIKRIFDFVLSLIGLFLTGPIIILLIIVSSIDTNSFGLFFQKRVGQYGKLFTIFKIKTVEPVSGAISAWGRLLRKSKMDELPQFFNILIGDMSFVGPRPDIPGYYDLLENENRLILNLKPGLTSESSLKYSNEEMLLSQQENPLLYNDSVIFPDKVKQNLAYYYHRSFFLDWKILIKTIFFK
jgi:lipopolysaccharide/colanic/teichoic acid biosynthesis glycosyltransferase